MTCTTAKEPAMADETTPRLHIWSIDGEHWVCASDVEDALDVVGEYYGEEEISAMSVRMLRPAETLRVTYESERDVPDDLPRSMILRVEDDDDDPSCVVDIPASAWAQYAPRGFIASTEF